MKSSTNKQSRPQSLREVSELAASGNFDAYLREFLKVAFGVEEILGNIAAPKNHSQSKP